MRCIHCGKTTEGTFVYCPHCGKRRPKTIDEMKEEQEEAKRSGEKACIVFFAIFFLAAITGNALICIALFVLLLILMAIF